MEELNWTTAETIGMLTAEELAAAFDRAGVSYIAVTYGDEESSTPVGVAFNGIQDAGKAVELGVPVDDTIGGFYDRVTSNCLTLTALAQDDVPEDDARVAEALESGWSWVIHPDRLNGRKGWHVSVDMSVADAQQLTANLNASRRAARS